MMRYQVAASFLVLTFMALPAGAQSLPPIKTGPGNQTAACATPGRMMAFVKQRNRALDHRFDVVATEYMRHGEALGVRWDYAFFQMLLETGNLSFTRGNGQPGNVRPFQNNFAGLGAAGRGQHGESFPDVSSGVKAHLQHLLLYAGDHIADPVADRTRKVQEWGILTSWQRSLGRPVTFADMSSKWAPSDRGYAKKIQAIASAFFSDICNTPDPRPELVAEARGGRSQSPAKIAESTNPKNSGTALARKAIEESRAESGQRSSLGATSIAAAGAVFSADGPVTLPDTMASGQTESRSAEDSAVVKTASAGAAAASAGASAAAPSKSKCRVWTASYGGQKSVIIKAVDNGLINYTVLDVNEGSEKREMEAYIAAYAKGGVAIGEFANQMSALDKAFELCPEG